jgi:hypothetical protein
MVFDIQEEQHSVALVCFVFVHAGLLVAGLNGSDSILFALPVNEFVVWYMLLQHVQFCHPGVDAAE